jgi:hypothetical protein
MAGQDVGALQDGGPRREKGKDRFKSRKRKTIFGPSLQAHGSSGRMATGTPEDVSRSQSSLSFSS